jgi:hypothetical protein
MSVIVSSTATGSHHFLRDTVLFTGLFAAAKDSPFLLFIVGMLATAFAVAVWLELAVREAAIYVIVLMLPLMFSAMVWPARRVWATRAVEMLVALILSKFVIVAVLSLGAGALGHLGVVSAMAGIALLMLAAFSPWMLLRLLPMSEMAGAAGSMSERLHSHGSTGVRAVTGAEPVGHVHQTMRDLAGAAMAWRHHESTGDDDVHTSRAGSYAGAGGTLGGATNNGDGGSGSSGLGGGGGGSSGASGSSGGAPPNGSGGGGEPSPVGAAPSGNSAPGQTGERLPGLNATLQAANYAHRDTVLGLDDEHPTPPPALQIDPDGPEDRDLTPEPQPDLEDEP